MKIVCAESVLFGPEAFGTVGDVVVLPDRAISRENLREADALVIRSKTDVQAALLDGTRVSFVGTATAGFDHMDTAYLDGRGLAWCAAAGCNANSVAEYFTAAVLCLAHRHGLALEKMTVGVVGVGQVGSRVVRKAEALGMKTLWNDPPLKLTTGDSRYIELDDLLHEADVVTLHVPLTRTGPFPTFRMADCHFFEWIKPGAIFINTSRGEVADSEVLQLVLEKGVISHAVLDVWDAEPAIPPDLLARVDLGSPHIAGYSFEGRLNGTIAVYNALCRYFELKPTWTPDEKLMPKPVEIRVDAGHKADESVLWEIVRQAYDIEADDRALRQGAPCDEKVWSDHVEALRRHYPERREFAADRVRLASSRPALVRKLRDLGFII